MKEWKAQPDPPKEVTAVKRMNGRSQPLSSLPLRNNYYFNKRFPFSWDDFHLRKHNIKTWAKVLKKSLGKVRTFAID